MALGIRSLLGVLPGSSITTPIADFFFKSLALDKMSSLVGKILTSTSKCYGAGATVELYPVSIAAGSPIGAVAKATATLADSRVWISRSPFVRISNLQVRLVPTTMQRAVSGSVAIGWIPYTTEDAQQFS
ncbi:unnamed protein product [Heligmosomoides polygyrus]|uniref:DUF1758 domain-containing protein n=1 Tax=Heligmosomoides polygyrus TaxID=6339 RepID=A0A183GFZ0_HELPZ|nr:unnamed protein product [Heligmosomoides polygyrus]